MFEWSHVYELKRGGEYLGFKFLVFGPLFSKCIDQITHLTLPFPLCNPKITTPTRPAVIG